MTPAMPEVSNGPLSIESLVGSTATAREGRSLGRPLFDSSLSDSWRAAVLASALVVGSFGFTEATAAAKATKPAAAKPAVASAMFQPSTLDMPNPERGWYAFGEDLSQTTEKRVKEIYRDGFRISFATVNLWQYRMSPMPQDYIDSLNRGFELYRANGVKVLLRVVYNYEANSPDAPLPVIMIHLNQLKPMLAQNTDVIAYVQAGLVGSWGEWHSSTNELTQPPAKAAIRDALLAAVPQSLYVQFRYPRDLMAWLPKPLDASGAFKGTPQARTSTHNDCFMSSPNDVGTYASAPEATQVAEREYVRAVTDWTPYGGETCSGFAPTRQTCADILKEGPAYHLTYLNRYFFVDFHKQWQAEGCFDEVSRQLGYRMQIDQVTHAPTVAAGQDVTVNVDMRNVGWSRIFSARKMVVSLRDKESGTVIEARGDADMRMLPPQGKASTKVAVSLKVPEGTPAGNYAVWLAMPDVGQKTVTDPRFAVRFANEDVSSKGQQWDAAAARFSTGTTVVVQ